MTRQSDISNATAFLACLAGAAICTSQLSKHSKVRRGRSTHRVICQGQRHQRIAGQVENATRIARQLHEMELEQLQGIWQDNDGHIVDVSGDMAEWRMPDTIGDVHASVKIVQQIARTSDGLQLADLQLVNGGGKPLWKSTTGTYYQWKRPEETGWQETFHQYKLSRLQLRKQLWASVRAEDYAAAASLRNALAVAGTLPEKCTVSQQLRLGAGHQFSSGVCFVHRTLNKRGVIIACEPWCDPCQDSVSAPAYHCLIETAGVGEVVLVPETEMIATVSAFPLQTRQLDDLMVPCAEIGGYLPRPKLDEVLQQQRSQAGSRLCFT